MSAERVISTERINWVQRGIAVAGFIAGLAIIQENFFAGAATLLGSWLVWNHSHHPAVA